MGRCGLANRDYIGGVQLGLALGGNMKASEIILEEFEAQSKYYEEVIISHDVIGNEVLEIFKSFENLTQAYKNALYMEEQLDKRDGAGFDPASLYPLVESVNDKCPLCGKKKLETMLSYDNVEAPHKKLNDYLFLRCKKCEAVSVQKKFTVPKDVIEKHSYYSAMEVPTREMIDKWNEAFKP